MFLKIKVVKYSSVGDGVWSSTPETISSAFDVSVNLSLGSKKDTFSFKIPLPANKNFDLVKAQDKVNIYYLINGASESASNLLINGLVKKVSGISGSSKYLVVNGVSFSEIAGNALVFHNNSSVNVMQFLKGCLESVELRNKNFGVGWESGNPLTNKYNPDTGAYDGDSFPLLNGGDLTKEFDKSLSSLLDKYLQDEYTEDGRYFWFINNSNKLVIRKRTGSISDTFVEGSGVKSVKFGVNADDVKNFVVVKCGFDNNNVPITTRYDDPVSRAKHGFRYYMLVDTSIAKKWKESGLYTSDNSGLRTRVKEEGRAKGEAFAVAHNKGFLTATLSIPPTTSYGLGDKVGLTSVYYPDVSDNSKKLNNYPMRISELSYDSKGVSVLLMEEVASI